MHRSILTLHTNYPALARIVLFIIGGGLSTSVTYILYSLFNLILNYQWAYFIGYFLGVLLAYWFNTVLVFGATMHWRGFISYPVIYIIQYIISAILLALVVESGYLSKIVAPLVITIMLFPLTYLMNKLIIGWNNRCNEHRHG